MRVGGGIFDLFSADCNKTLGILIIVGYNYNVPKISFLGTTGDVTTCECCGRDNLKKTVALLIDDEVRYYGTQCAANALSGFYKSPVFAQEVTRWARKGDQERRLSKHLAFRKVAA